MFDDCRILNVFVVIEHLIRAASRDIKTYCVLEKIVALLLSVAYQTEPLFQLVFVYLQSKDFLFVGEYSHHVSNM